MAATSIAFEALVLFVAVFGALSSGSPSAPRDANAPDAAADVNICRGMPCPSYRVVNKLSDDIEERSYDAVDLPAYTSTQCMSLKSAASQGYYHLSMYTRGGRNAANKALRMGVPVLTEAKHVSDVEPKCSWIYTTLFYVSGTQLPDPVNTTITIKQLATSHFYVQSFGGYASHPAEVVLALRIRLNSRKLCYDPSTYYIAAYNSPQHEINRRNEIWLPARPCVPTMHEHDNVLESSPVLES